MCGIVGIVSEDPSVLEPRRMRRALDSIARRGPDQEGTFNSGEVYFGHKRLSIIDLSESARQPMRSPCGRFVITYNGEIYNYREVKAELENGTPWYSQSDTEVILRAYEKWGEVCVKKLHGMFSFAIWDSHKRTLFAARDRMGEKPFYFTHQRKSFAFASRPRALFELLPNLSKEFDPQGLRDFLEIGYFGREHSYFKEIHKLLPGHTLTLSDGNVTTKPYWTFLDIERDTILESLSEDELLNEMDQLLTSSVRERMVSDVPIGSFLSGGIDSSLVTAIMQKLSKSPVKTFTIGFAETENDESLHAAAIAKHLRTEHRCEVLKVDDLLSLFPLFMSEFDEPFFDHSAFPTMAVSRLARKHVTVALTGDGGDESFGGYHYYRIVTAVAFFLGFPESVRVGLNGVLSQIPIQKLQALAGALKKGSPEEVFGYSRSLTKNLVGLFSPEFINETQSISTRFSQFRDLFPSSLSAADRAMRLDLLFTLPDDYLQKVDQSTMAFSLESRAPFLDHRVVEWGARLGHLRKMHGGQNKYLLRKLAYRYIPQSILDRPKQGFGVPMSRWLRGKLKDWGEERLHAPSAFAGLPLNKARCLELWKAHQSGAKDHHSLLWAVLVLLDFNIRLKDQVPQVERPSATTVSEPLELHPVV